MRCKATTKQGRPCRNAASQGSAFCATHNDNLDVAEVASTALGGILGNFVVPGFGGALGGAIAGNIVNRIIRDQKMAKKKVFVSFDFDNDKIIKDFIIGQSKLPDSPFEVSDHSLKEAAPESGWELKAKAAISRSDIVIVMVGPHTHRAHGVLKEVQMARNAGKHIVQIIGYRDGDYTPVPDAGRLYRWNWENLKSLLG